MPCVCAHRNCDKFFENQIRNRRSSPFYVICTPETQPEIRRPKSQPEIITPASYEHRRYYRLSEQHPGLRGLRQEGGSTNLEGKLNLARNRRTILSSGIDFNSPIVLIRNTADDRFFRSDAAMHRYSASGFSGTPSDDLRAACRAVMSCLILHEVVWSLGGFVRHFDPTVGAGWASMRRRNRRGHGNWRGR